MGVGSSCGLRAGRECWSVIRWFSGQLEGMEGLEGLAGLPRLEALLKGVG